MSYSQDEIQENNDNSWEQKALAKQLSKLRNDIERTQTKLTELKETEKNLAERMSDLRKRNNRLAEDAGLEAPAPGQKPTKGWWRQIRAECKFPFGFEGIPGKILENSEKSKKSN